MAREKTIMSLASAPPPALRSRGIFTVTRGADVGRVISLPTRGSATIGRNEECAIRFDEGSVSGQHGLVVGMNGSYVFEDKGSTNGSFVNDERCQKAIALGDGDRLRFGTTTVVRFSLVDEQEEAELKKVYEAALRDALTGAVNRSALEERLAAEIAYANRHQAELSILIFDLDHFKRVNDTYGHLGGDAVLRSVAETARRTLRTEDTLGRYGGEEFVVVARGVGLAQARVFAERLREAIAATPVPFERAVIPVTASGGVAAMSCCGATRDRATILSIADARLYRAKAQGRNRIVSD